jgi:hypothetical protein
MSLNSMATCLLQRGRELYLTFKRRAFTYANAHCKNTPTNLLYIFRQRGNFLHFKDTLCNYTRWSKSLCAPDDYSTTDDLKMAIIEYIRNVDCAILNSLWEHSLACQWMSGDWWGTLWTLLVIFCIVIIKFTQTFWSPCKTYPNKMHNF